MKYLTFALMALLAACSYVNPVTAVRLAQQNPMDADPADISVYFRLPPGLGIVPGTAIFGIEATNRNTEEVIERDYILIAKQSRDLLRFSLSPADVADLRLVQNRVKNEWGRRSTKGSLSAFSEFCTIGDGPADDAVISVLVGTDPSSAPVSLIRNAPIWRAETEELRDQLPPCTTGHQ